MGILEKLGFRKTRQTKNKNFKVDDGYHEVFQYEYLPTFDKETDDFMIRFHKVQNADQLIGKLLILVDGLEFHIEEMQDIWMNDEIWINVKSPNGIITITRDIYDFVFILGETITKMTWIRLKAR